MHLNAQQKKRQRLGGGCARAWRIDQFKFG